MENEIPLWSMPQTFKTEEKFRALFEYASEGILVADNEGVIQLANPAAEKLFNYSKDELIGKKVEILIPQRYSKHHSKLRDEFSEHPSARSMGVGRDLYGIDKNGQEFPVEISLSPYKTDEGVYTIAFIIDITIRKKNEESIKKQKSELESLTQELEQRVKDRTMILEEALEQLELSKKQLVDALEKEKELSEMKSRFVSMASHEFRTPLTTILSSLSLVNTYIDNGNKEKQQHHIQRIKASVNNMTDMLEDVLSISKLEEGKINSSYEWLDIKKFIENIVQDMEQVTKNNQKIIFIHSGSNNVFLDAKALRTIITNLLSNAIKFSTESKPISITSNVGNEEIVLQIKDEGLGISQEDQEHLFERFFRGDNVVNIQGTGLGLSIVARYVELLNGKISFNSKLNEGTTFSITISNNNKNEQEGIIDRRQ